VREDGTAQHLEVDHEEGVKSELYKFAYPLADGSGEIWSPHRPETMLGDTRWRCIRTTRDTSR